MTATSAAPTVPPRSAVPWVLAAGAAAAASAAASLTVAIAGDGAPHLLEWFIVGALVAFGIPLALRDFSAHQLPDLLVWPLYGVIGALVAVCGVLEADLGRAGIALLIGALMWGLYFVMGLFGASSYGDVKLAGALGLALGWWGILPALVGAALAYFLALPHALTGTIRSRGRGDGTRTRIPFGPYMLAGAIAVGLVLVTR